VAVASLREREEGGRRSLERLEALRQELRGRLVLIKSRQEEAELSQLRLGQERERLRVELDVLYRRREEENARYLALRERFDAGGQQVEEQELALKGVRARLNEARDALATVQLKVRELRMETEHLVQSFLDRYRIDLLEVQDPREDKALDPDVAGRRLGELRRLVDEMGEVNLTAIEEYQELETRYEFLAGQQEDLRQSLEGLQSAITKINRTTRKRFRETFDLVNAKFQEVFPRLFRGGTAELRLTDEQDLLETGIEIVVQPPGKRLQNVNLLSGGEKALTAVALIFSIFLIKPTPFCMLDEVDAPLDDANIGRFNEMVREMSAVSQFIIITHNKRTMEIADSLYGVTMEEPGVSKLVSVRINEF
jgi:chromosome segregation protein